MCKSTLRSHRLPTNRAIGHQHDLHLRILLLIHLIHLLQCLHPRPVFAISSLGRVTTLLFIIILDGGLVLATLRRSRNGQRLLVHIEVKINDIGVGSLRRVILVVRPVVALRRRRPLVVILGSQLLTWGLKRCAFSAHFTGLRVIVHRAAVLLLVREELIGTAMSSLGSTGHSLLPSIGARSLDPHGLVTLLGDSPLLVNFVAIDLRWHYTTNEISLIINILILDRISLKTGQLKIIILIGQIKLK